MVNFLSSAAQVCDSHLRSRSSYFCSNNQHIESINTGAQRETPWNIQARVVSSVLQICPHEICSVWNRMGLVRSRAAHVSAMMIARCVVFPWFYSALSSRMLWPTLSSCMLLQNKRRRSGGQSDIQRLQAVCASCNLLQTNTSEMSAGPLRWTLSTPASFILTDPVKTDILHLGFF